MRWYTKALTNLYSFDLGHLHFLALEISAEALEVAR